MFFFFAFTFSASQVMAYQCSPGKSTLQGKYLTVNYTPIHPATIHSQVP